jgi:hypothetical protein
MKTDERPADAEGGGKPSDDMFVVKYVAHMRGDGAG